MSAPNSQTVVLPVEPTEAMLLALCRAILATELEPWGKTQSFKDAYAAMLAAAPKSDGPAERDALYPVAVQLRTQLAQCIGVLDGQDLTRPEVMVEESRRVMRESYESLKRLSATEGTGG